MLSELLQSAPSGVFRGIEAHGQRVVSPGIGEFMAAIGHIEEADAELPRGGVEAASLVTEF